MTHEPHAQYVLIQENDLHVIIKDLDRGRTVTNDADYVTRKLNDQVKGLGKRRLFYIDTMGQADELLHTKGVFSGFKACSPSQRETILKLVNPV